MYESDLIRFSDCAKSSDSGLFRQKQTKVFLQPKSRAALGWLLPSGRPRQSLRKLNFSVNARELISILTHFQYRTEIAIISISVFKVVL